MLGKNQLVYEEHQHAAVNRPYYAAQWSQWSPPAVGAFSLVVIIKLCLITVSTHIIDAVGLAMRL